MGHHQHFCHMRNCNFQFEKKSVLFFSKRGKKALWVMSLDTRFLRLIPIMGYFFGKVIWNPTPNAERWNDETFQEFRNGFAPSIATILTKKSFEQRDFKIQKQFRKSIAKGFNRKRFWIIKKSKTLDFWDSSFEWFAKIKINQDLDSFYDLSVGLLRSIEMLCIIRSHF